MSVSDIIEYYPELSKDKETILSKVKEKCDYIKSINANYSSFNSNYDSWRRSVRRDIEALKIYESHGKVTGYAAIYTFVSFLILVLSINLTVIAPSLFISVLLSVGILIYTFTFNKRTVYGNEQYVRLKAFKRFLEDFGTFDIKELPELPLWEKYLVYATVLGVAKKLSKTMSVKIQEMNVNGSNFTFTDYYLYNSLARDLNQSINGAVATARQASAAAAAASSMSSGSGGGGGFSSGGGFGGGGGGGHGF